MPKTRLTHAIHFPIKRAAYYARMKTILFVILFAANALAAGVKTGGARLIPVDGKYNVWTDEVGKGPIKMLTLHGGPGFPHDYLECFEDFLLCSTESAFTTTTSSASGTPPSRTTCRCGPSIAIAKKSSRSARVSASITSSTPSRRII